MNCSNFSYCIKTRWWQWTDSRAPQSPKHHLLPGHPKSRITSDTGSSWAQLDLPQSLSCSPLRMRTELKIDRPGVGGTSAHTQDRLPVWRVDGTMIGLPITSMATRVHPLACVYCKWIRKLIMVTKQKAPNEFLYKTKSGCDWFPEHCQGLSLFFYCG